MLALKGGQTRPKREMAEKSEATFLGGKNDANGSKKSQMSWSFLRSYIENTFPDKPISLKAKDGSEAKSLPELLPLDLLTGSYFYVNPLLALGHLQTVYTALNSFDNVDQIWYKRRVLNVESNSRFYTVDGDKLAYDRWEGKLTITVDYVVGADKTDKDHERFKPASQIKELPPRTEYLNPDDEQLLLNDESRPLVIALHGLSGGSYELYIRAFLNKVTEEKYGFDALVLNARGCANHTITTPQLFNGLWTNDLRYLINEHILQKWPNKRIYLIGFLLGGAIVANYIAQEGSAINSQIKGSAIMGTPWDFSDSLYHIGENILGHYIYSPTMAQNLMRLLNEHYHTHLKHDKYVENYKANPSQFKVQMLRDFDDHFTAKIFGFNNADEYYRHASPVQRLLKVCVPTLIVSSKDDPIIGVRSLPYSEVKINPYTSFVTTTIGGHLGWFKLAGSRWYTEPVAQYFANLDKYDVDKLSIRKEDLPADITKIWGHDRILSQPE